jgi:hypothetical protein
MKNSKFEIRNSKGEIRNAAGPQPKKILTQRRRDTETGRRCRGTEGKKSPQNGAVSKFGGFTAEGARGNIRTSKSEGGNGGLCESRWDESGIQFLRAAGAKYFGFRISNLGFPPGFRISSFEFPPRAPSAAVQPPKASARRVHFFFLCVSSAPLRLCVKSASDCSPAALRHSPSEFRISNFEFFP